MPGRMDELKGSVKEQAGDVLGNEQMEAEGKAERLGAKAARETEGARDEAVGGIKRAAGDVLDNEQMQAEGEAQRLKGKAAKMG